jgi:hypothetical protein
MNHRLESFDGRKASEAKGRGFDPRQPHQVIDFIRFFGIFLSRFFA